jgi:hypothetical protein
VPDKPRAGHEKDRDERREAVTDDDRLGSVAYKYNKECSSITPPPLRSKKDDEVRGSWRLATR